MKIDKLYDHFNSMNNTSQAGFFRPVADFIPAVIAVSLEIFNTLCKQQTKSQVVKDALIPFRKAANVIVKKEGNDYIAKYPDDYKYFESAGIIASEGGKIVADDNCRLWNGKEWKESGLDMEDFVEVKETNYTRYPLTEVTANKWNAVLSHPTRKPRYDKAYITQRSIGFEVAPKDIGVIVISYYRLPKEPKFNYTVVNDDPDIYLRFKEDGSEHLEWGDEMMPAFLYMLANRFGYTISDELKLQVTSIDKSLL